MVGLKFDSNECCQPLYRCYAGPNRAVSTDAGMTWTDVITGAVVDGAILNEGDCTRVQLEAIELRRNPPQE